MAYDEHLADRLREALERRSVPFSEKKMFGGICFMVDDKMCLGVLKSDLITRVSPEEEASWLQRPATRKVDFTGRPMRGYYFVSPERVDHQKELDFWVDACLAYNPTAKASKKKKK